MLALTGLRAGELFSLEGTDVDKVDGGLQVRVKTTHDGFAWSPKDWTDRKIPVHPRLAEYLAELRPRAVAGYVVPGPAGANRADNIARAALKKLKKLAPSTKVPAKKLTLHNFRRYFVSQCADCGIDMACVMEWVGHGDFEMVMHYYRLRDEHAKAAMRRYTTEMPAAGSVDRRPIQPAQRSRRGKSAIPQGVGSA